jgi:hypothetical protein
MLFLGACLLPCLVYKKDKKGLNFTFSHFSCAHHKHSRRMCSLARNTHNSKTLSQSLSSYVFMVVVCDDIAFALTIENSLSCKTAFLYKMSCYEDSTPCQYCAKYHTICDDVMHKYIVCNFLSSLCSYNEDGVFVSDCDMISSIVPMPKHIHDKQICLLRQQYAYFAYKALKSNMLFCSRFNTFYNNAFIPKQNENKLHFNE